MAIGNFDGVHRGHARIVERLLERARDHGGPALVFTFEPHPVRLLRPDQCPPPLTWLERKAELLATLGVDWIFAYPTDRELLNLRAREFFDQIVRQVLDARALVEGPNFFFGHNREGNVDLLRQFVAAADMTLDVVEPLALAGDLVSSSRVRDAIRLGHVSLACQMLTAPYRIRGMVTHGAGRGATLGFPTANLDAIDTLIPQQGVYAGMGHFDGTSRPAAINIGPNPTFGEFATKVEVYLVDVEETLYGRPLEIDFLERLRDIRPFPSREKLVEQLQTDVRRVIHIAKQHSMRRS